MHPNAIWLAAMLSVGFALYVLHLVRRGHLRESYALIWLGAVTAMALFALQHGWIDAIGHFLGVAYPPALFLLLGLLFSLAISLNLTVHVSRHHDRTVRLAQEVALLRQRLEEVERRHGVRAAGE